MKKRLKKVALGMLFSMSLSTVGAITSTYTSTVNASTHKTKHKKASTKKVSTKKASKSQLMAQLTKDVSDYNSAVKDLDYPINGNDTVEYTLTAPNYSQTYSGMSDSLHAMAHDMSINKVDPYDTNQGDQNTIYVNDTNLNILAQTVSQFYGMFSNRLKSKMSSSDFKNLSDIRDETVRNQAQIEQYLAKNNTISASSDMITNQWKNVQNFYNLLGDNVNKIN